MLIVDAGVPVLREIGIRKLPQGLDSSWRTGGLMLRFMPNNERAQCASLFPAFITFFANGGTAQKEMYAKLPIEACQLAFLGWFSCRGLFFIPQSKNSRL